MSEHERSKNQWNKKALTRFGHDRVIAAFADVKIRFLQKHIPDLENKKVLEVGCGDGFISRHLMNKTHLIGVDLSSGMLAKNPLEQKALASTYELPFPDNSFDLVFESNMLHHLGNPRRAIAEMVRVSNRYVFLSEPNKNSLAIFLSHRIDPDERHCPLFDHHNLERLLQDAGLMIIAGQSHGRVPPKRTPPWLLGILTLMESFVPGGFFAVALGKIP